MEQETTQYQPPTGPRIKRNVLIIAALVLVAVLGTTVTTLSIQSSGGPRRNANVIPRSLDIWAVESDGNVRFASLFTPVENELEEQIDVAGPLVVGADAVLNAEAIGGEIASVETLNGPGRDSTLIYNRYTLRREDTAEPYGINVLTADSPYLSPAPANPSQQVLSLGTVAQDYYTQAIVAVLIPTGTEIVSSGGADDLSPYREARFAGWQVFYYDVTDATGSEAIRVTFLPPVSSAPALDPFQVSRRR